MRRGDGIWTHGETIEVRVAFNEAVSVRGGAATLGITIAGGPAILGLGSGSGSATLVFVHEVADQQARHTQIGITANSLGASGGTIASQASGLVADLSHEGTEPTAAPDPDESVPLTAEFRGLPASHDESAFTFALHFSEEFSLSRTTLHDHALEVTNGELTEVAPKETGKNQAWDVTVTPGGDDDVTIALAATTDCAATGAICTADNRPLSAAVSATVVGPDEEEDPPESNTVVLEPPAQRDDRDIGAITLTADPPGTIQAAWEEPTETPANYRIAWAKVGENFRTWTDPSGNAYPTEPAYTITDLDEGEEYKVKVRASYSGTAGDWSGEATITVAESPANEPPDNQPAVPLTASFESVPSSHDESAFTFALRFSEEFSLSRTTLQDHALEVTNGELTGLSRLERGKNQAWDVTVTPDGDADVTITLVATTDCAATGAVCTSDNHPLSAAVTATVVGPLRLSVADASATEADDATVDFAVTLSRASSADVTVDYATSDGTATAGEDYTDTSGTLTFAAGETAKTVAVPVMDDATDEDDETLTLTLTNASGGGVSLQDATATGTIADDDEAPAEPLTASFEDVPSSHDESAFTFALRFSEEFSLSRTTLQDHALEVTNGELTGLSRQQTGKNQAWDVTITPNGDADVTITLVATTDCTATGAVCTGDNRPLSASVSATVVGPLSLSVADASATEADDATVDFTVTLSRASSSAVTVDYATSDGSATAGADYTSTSGTLTFAAGETAKTVSVPVLDDATDEDAETLTLTLSGASGGGVSLDDGTATGTIADDDEAPAQPLTASFENVPVVPRRVGVHFCVALLRGVQPELHDAARPRAGGDQRRTHRSRTPRNGEESGVECDGRAQRRRGCDDHASGDDRLRGDRCDLHGGQPPAIGGGFGDGGRSAGAVGGRCECNRSGCDGGLHGDAEPGGVNECDGGLRHLGRLCHGGRRLHGHVRYADVCGR